jgi:hypothetical protein
MISAPLLLSSDFIYLAPWLTRWISPDAAGAVDGLNLFAKFVASVKALITTNQNLSMKRQECLDLHNHRHKRH